MTKCAALASMNDTFPPLGGGDNKNVMDTFASEPAPHSGPTAAGMPTDPTVPAAANDKFWRRKPPARAAAKVAKGDCRAPDNHRYWHHTMADGTAALLDSWGPEVTSGDYGCEAGRTT